MVYVQEPLSKSQIQREKYFVEKNLFPYITYIRFTDFATKLYLKVNRNTVYPLFYVIGTNIIIRTMLITR